MKKYEFTGEVKKEYGKELQQIRALTDLVIDGETIEAGTVGGWIENEENLSHDGNAWVSDDAQVYGNARVCENAKIEKITDYFSVGPIGSRNDVTTFFRCADKSIKVKCGRFRGTLAEFTEKADESHGDSKHGQVYKLAIELAKKQLEE